MGQKMVWMNVLEVEEAPHRTSHRKITSTPAGLSAISANHMEPDCRIAAFADLAVATLPKASSRKSQIATLTTTARNVHRVSPIETNEKGTMDHCNHFNESKMLLTVIRQTPLWL